MRQLLPIVLMLVMLVESANAAAVTITVTNIDASGGDVRMVMYNDPANWLTHHGANVTTQPATQGEMTFRFPDINPGSYAILVYHDTNRNQDLDENFLGIPTEQFGFTNNPGYNHKPEMTESLFTVTDQPVALTIKLSDD